MEIGGIVEAIGSVGFPIVMCLITMYYWNNQFKEFTDKLAECVSQLKDAVSKNTNVIEFIKETLEDKKK